MKNLKHAVVSFLQNRVSAGFLCRMFTVSACLLICWAAFTVPASAVFSRDDTHGNCRSHVFDLITPEDMPSDGEVGGKAEDQMLLRGSASAQPETEEYIPLVMIVIEFDGEPYSTEYDWGAHIFDGDVSLKQYYKDMSFGKFTFLPVTETSAYGTDGNENRNDRMNDGIIHVSLSTKKEYGWAVGYDYYRRVTDVRAADLENMLAFADALQIAGEYMDFAQYDSNGDGVIQNAELAVGFIVAGMDAAQHIGFTASTIGRYFWPNAYSFSEIQQDWSSAFFGPPEEFPDAPRIDGVVVDSYIGIAEHYETNGRYDPDGGNLEQEGFGTLAHELGHYLGLPDFYDTAGYGAWRIYDSMYVSLMNYGCYGTDLEGNMVPFSLDIWSRIRLGWVEPMNFEPGSTVSVMDSMSSAEGYPAALRVNTPKDGEYYLIENRRFSGWDAGMKDYYPDAVTSDGDDFGGGLIVWHIDDRIVDEYMDTNGVNDSTHHPGIMPLFWEESDDGEFVEIGKYVDFMSPFFDPDNWGKALHLPQYGTTEEDTVDRPKDRIYSPLVLYMDTENAPVMKVHLVLSPPDERDLADYEAYKAEILSAIDSLAADDDSNTVRALIEEAKAAVTGLTYDESLTPADNKAEAAGILERLEAEVSAQREKDLAERIEEFTRYKESLKDRLDELLSIRNYERYSALIERAGIALEDLAYDVSRSLDENKTAADRIVELLRTDLDTLVRIGEITWNWTWEDIEPAAGQSISEMMEQTSTEPENGRRSPFFDVSVSDPYYDDVLFVFENGIMNGVSDTSFNPGGSLTRGMIVTILWRMEGEPEVPDVQVFDDVPVGEWYFAGVTWASETGIVFGYGDGTYGPDDPITREQLAVILFRYAQFRKYNAGVIGNTDDLCYDDASDISEWAAPAVRWACGMGMLGESTALRPTKAATRAEIAAAIRILLEAEA